MAAPPLTESSVLAMNVEQLADEIRLHDRLYWEDNAPAIADELYDLLVRRLGELDAEHPLLSRVGGEERAGLDVPQDLSAYATGDKVAHAHPMLSLEKCYDEDKLRSWYSSFNGPAMVTHKVDGVAISVRYDASGALVLGTTRGNGLIGEVITDNLRHVAGIPWQIDVPNLEVRGEAYVPLSFFRDKLSKEFKNPRNITAGALKRKTAAETARYGVHFYAYGAQGWEIESEEESRRRLTEMGFTPVPGELATVEEGQATFERMQEAREAIDFEVDGVVFKCNDLAQYAALGNTSHHPRGAIAYKYQGESGLTTLQGIEWSVSRTGAINPVALVKPISLSGVSVSRVSLHNLNIMEQLELPHRPKATPAQTSLFAQQEASGSFRLEPGMNEMAALSQGASVLVTRRGGVIPHIERVSGPRAGVLEIPDSCPTCGAPAERIEDTLVSSHTMTCASQLERQLKHFVDSVDIQGFGPKVLAALLERGIVQSPVDFFTLTVEDLLPLERMGRKSALKLIAAVESRRTLPLPLFLAALGIDDLGRSVSRRLATTFGTLDRIRGLGIEELVAVDGIGEIMAQRIVGGLEALAPTIDQLLAHITLEVVEEEVVVESDSAINGLSFVFTGKMESMSRGAAQKEVKERGGSCPSGVSKTLHFLVLGDADFPRFEAGWRSSKLKKAEALAEAGAALRIISESEFLKMLES